MLELQLYRQQPKQRKQKSWETYCFILNNATPLDNAAEETFQRILHKREFAYEVIFPQKGEQPGIEANRKLESFPEQI